MDDPKKEGGKKKNTVKRIFYPHERGKEKNHSLPGEKGYEKE